MGKLLSEEQISTIPNLYDTEDLKDPLCHVKLFTPDSNWTWFIIEISQEDKNLCYGYIKGLESELGYFTIQELESIAGPLGVKIEVDLSFIPKQLSEVKKKQL